MGHDNGEMWIVGFKIPKMNQAYVRVTCLCSRTAQELIFMYSSRIGVLIFKNSFKNLNSCSKNCLL